MSANSPVAKYKSIDLWNNHSKLVATDNWIGPLRLCVKICRDDEVDSVLLAITTPQNNESASVSHFRIIIGALCLADEPNVSKQTAELILRKFTRYSRKKDYQLDMYMKMAINELNNSRWADHLNA